jgi:hypothetical protein
MVELIRLGREHGHDRLRETVGVALELGCTDVEAIRHLLDTETLNQASRRALGEVELGRLARYERPAPDVGHYDALISEVNS